jgi:hypothetical protein
MTEHRIMIDGTFICGWCGQQQPVFGRRPTRLQVETAYTVSTADDGEVRVIFPPDGDASGRSMLHECRRPRPNYHLRDAE